MPGSRCAPWPKPPASRQETSRTISPASGCYCRAVVAHMVAGYSTQFEALLTDTRLRPGQDLKSLVQWLLADAVTEETVRTFRELWAISLHDDETRQADRRPVRRAHERCGRAAETLLSGRRGGNHAGGRSTPGPLLGGQHRALRHAPGSRGVPRPHDRGRLTASRSACARARN